MSLALLRDGPLSAKKLDRAYVSNIILRAQVVHLNSTPLCETRKSLRLFFAHVVAELC